MCVNKICENCFRDYNIIPSRAKESHYCSIKCKANAFRTLYRGKNNPAYGKPRPDMVLINKSKEHIEKVRLKHIGSKRSEDTKRKIAEKSRESRLKEKKWQGYDNPFKIPNYNSKTDYRYTSNALVELRLKLIKKYDYKCQKCNKSFKDNTTLLHLHHIIPRRENGSDDEDNLMIYCYKCHKKIDYIMIQSNKKL